ncbi:hypothetical protein SAMN02745165_02820 [Malonomonas rubra DSM 5091]|uniref:DUF6933 domain-containing protein n=1 Tax=Malonomonas rubra DSM 5091 TaxID=1122189 RepID=A0A1M6KW80_MALRU|nr:hypothetical protein [Malonomonas rubra]SHJ63227.1 hypothetical protein SAMN02745165_02820 [Malonomonas rubra DSM 5091]
MIAIQCTQKLLKEVGQEYKEAIIPTYPLGCWHANLLLLDRRKCALFTNDLTRYSFLAPGLKKPDIKNLEEVFRQKLFRSMRLDGFGQQEIERALEEVQEVAFTRTSDRSVLGTMNDMANIIKWAVYDAGGLLNVDIDEMNSKLNRMPIKPLDYGFSVERVGEVLKRQS